MGFKTNGISRRSESLAPRNAIRRSGFEESLVDERVKQGLRIVLRAGGSFSQVCPPPVNAFRGLALGISPQMSSSCNRLGKFVHDRFSEQMPLAARQEIIINELVNAVDALGREALVELANILARGIPGARGGLLGGLSPLSAILVPVQNPLARVQLSEEDKEALATVRAIMALFEEEGGAVHSIGQKGATNWDQELLPRLLQDPRLSIRSSLAMGQVRQQH